MGERWDSNPRQPEPQSGALPTELRPPCYHAPEKNRTPDPQLRRLLLYPTELLAQKCSGWRDSNPRSSGPKPDAMNRTRPHPVDIDAYTMKLLLCQQKNEKK